MKIVIDARAAFDLEHIFHFIAAENPGEARRIVDRIVVSIERLGLFPDMGRAGQIEGTREWVIPRLPYIVVYRIAAARDQLTVVAVFHQAQDRQTS